MAAAATPVPFSVKDRSAIITGAGSGINLCFARLLLSKRCNVLLADVNLRPEAQELLEEYSEKSGNKSRAVFKKTDVADWKDLSAMFETGDREFGGIDLVCPGAGIFEPDWSNFWHPPGSEKSRDDPQGGRYSTIDINVTHPIRVTQLAIQYFLSPHRDAKACVTNPKRIVHISSIAGQVAALTTPIYIASKHAISGFVYSLAPLDAALGIRVNGVAPGIIKTPLWTDHPDKMKYVDDTRDDWASPEEVAEAMLDLVEDPDLPGGTVLEVGHNNRRKVPMLNNPGPRGSGLTASGLAAETEGILGRLTEEG